MSDEDAYKLPEGYGIKKKMVSLGEGKNKVPALQVSLHTTHPRVEINPYYMGSWYGDRDFGTPATITVIEYSEEPLKVADPAKNLEELSLAVGELIVEAIEHNGYDQREKEFAESVKKWTEDTGIKFG